MAMPATVFQAGPLAVDVRHVDQSTVPGLPKPVMVVAPTEEGTYPVTVFLHGTNMVNSWYQHLLTHVASHGFIAVAPQLSCIALNLNDMKDIDATKRVTNWLADQHEGLNYVLKDIFKLDNVKPDLSRLALAGHSRGGDTTFAIALGLGDATAELALKFSAIIGVDPVAGLSKALQVEPKVLTYKPGSFNLGRMPVLVIGTGLGPRHIGSIPCAPAGVNHAEFYSECQPPRYHMVAKDYGHLDMLDDNVPYVINCMCMRNQNNTKDLARRTMGGAMVAFMRATLEGSSDDLEAILDKPPKLVAPAVLDPVEHNEA